MALLSGKMAASMRCLSRIPLVVILGATGSGKSKLAIEIASKYGGEIISADSMQVYQGLDIITNKVTTEEQRQCRHHVINYVNPLKMDYSVVQFRDTALPVIEQILAQDKIPVIVGGTNYYIEALLWKFLLEKEDTAEINQLASNKDNQDVLPSCNNQMKQCQPVKPDLPSGGKRENQYHGDQELVESTAKMARLKRGDTDKDSALSHAADNKDNAFSLATDGKCPPHQDPRKIYEKVSTELLYEKLSSVDPVSARRIHPKDRRKITRALEVYSTQGVLMSDLLEAQHSQAGAGTQLSGPLRFPNTCVIWIRCDQEVLDARTDKRVDDMLARGLVRELSDFHKEYNTQRLAENKSADYTRGIWQSIGFKEFHPYLMLSEAEQQSKQGELLLQQGVEDLKRATRQYARRQSKWIVGRFLRRQGAHVPPVYAVDSTVPDQWDDQVFLPASQVVQAAIKGEKPPFAALPREENYNVRAYNVCEVCNLVFVTTKEWEAHMKGRRHKRRVSSKAAAERRSRSMPQHHPVGASAAGIEGSTTVETPVGAEESATLETQRDTGGSSTVVTPRDT